MSQEPEEKQNTGEPSEKPPLYEEFLREVGGLLDLAFSYFDIPIYDDEVNGARRQFFMVRPDEELVIQALKPIDRYNFIVWFLCDYRLEKDQSNPIRHFFTTTMARDLTAHQKLLLEKIADSYLSIYDMAAIKAETGEVTLLELFSSRGVKLQDPRLLQMADGTLFFALRIINWRGRNYSIGDMYVYPDDMRDHLLMILQRRLVDPKAIVPPTLQEMLKSKGYIFNHIQMAVRNTDSYVTPKNPSTPEREKEKAVAPEKPKPQVGVSRAHFSVIDYEKSAEALKALSSLVFRGESDGGLQYSWFRKKGEPENSREDGRVTLTRRKLLFETVGIDDLEAGKSDIKKALKPHVQHTFDDLEKRRLTS